MIKDVLNFPSISVVEHPALGSMPCVRDTLASFLRTCWDEQRHRPEVIEDLENDTKGFDTLSCLHDMLIETRDVERVKHGSTNRGEHRLRRSPSQPGRFAEFVPVHNLNLRPLRDNVNNVAK
ncbi:MAG: hypothetical protein ACMG6S_07435 [Byssovorax sp.]